MDDPRMPLPGPAAHGVRMLTDWASPVAALHDQRVLMLTAALPNASNVSLPAERYGADNGRVARIIMASTVLAFVSFTLLAWGFGVFGG